MLYHHDTVYAQCVACYKPRPSPFGVVWCHLGRVIQDASAAVKDGTADPAQKRIVQALQAGGEHGSFRSVVP
jgi:hypothetical protein